MQSIQSKCKYPPKSDSQVIHSIIPLLQIGRSLSSHPYHSYLVHSLACQAISYRHIKKRRTGVKGKPAMYANRPQSISTFRSKRSVDNACIIERISTRIKRYPTPRYDDLPLYQRYLYSRSSESPCRCPCPTLRRSCSLCSCFEDHPVYVLARLPVQKVVFLLNAGSPMNRHIQVIDCHCYIGRRVLLTSDHCSADCSKDLVWTACS